MSDIRMETKHFGIEPADHLATDLEGFLQQSDVMVFPLQRGDRSILEALPGLGEVLITTGRAAASSTHRCRIASVQHFDAGTMLMEKDGGLCWLEHTWRAAMVIAHKDAPVRMPSLLLFGGIGDLAFRATPGFGESLEAFQTLIEEHKGCMNCLRMEAPAEQAPPVFDCPGRLIREAWCESRSRRDLETRLAGIGLDRLRGIRAMEGLYTLSIPLENLYRMLRGLVTKELPVHIQVGNRHCTSARECVLERIFRRETDWEAVNEGMVIRVVPALLQSAWRVTQPGKSTEMPRFEAFDAAGELVLACSCPLGVDEATLLAWERLVAEDELEVCTSASRWT